MSEQPATAPRRPGLLGAIVAGAGRRVIDLLDHAGGMVALFLIAMGWVWRALTRRSVRFGHMALISQIVRVGVRDRKSVV